MKGISASEGIALGRVVPWVNEKPTIVEQSVADLESELYKFHEAVNKSKDQIQRIKTKLLETVGEKEAQVFEAHLMMFDDPEWIGRIEKEIKEKSLNAEFITENVSSEIIAIFDAIDDEYLRARAADIRDVSKRLVKNILGLPVDLSGISEPSIIVAKDLSPSETAQLDKDMVLAFITEQGNKTSHSAIIARTMGIPAIVGASGIMDVLSQNETNFIALNGSTGDFDINPSENTLKEYRLLKKAFEDEQALIQKMIGQESITLDGMKVELAGNIAKPSDAEIVITSDGEGVGLFRSEFLFMEGSKPPTEEEQYKAYYKAAKILDGRPLIIRTLDAGGDKNIPYLNVEEEMNPFLGYRAIRISLEEVEMFKTQIRAILRVSKDYPVKIMFPMIATVSEFVNAKSIVQEVMDELDAYNENIEIGIMVEIPSTAIMADCFADYVDFFSIGTNDLTQYTLAADRMNPKLSKLYNHRDPAVLRLINMVIQAAHKKGKWVGMCGEAAGDPMMIPVLLGMGLDEFSMAPSSILRARSIVRKFDVSKSEKNIEALLRLHHVEAVEIYMKSILEALDD